MDLTEEPSERMLSFGKTGGTSESGFSVSSLHTGIPEDGRFIQDENYDFDDNKKEGDLMSPGTNASSWLLYGNLSLMGNMSSDFLVPEEFPYYIRITSTLLCGFILFIGIIGNILVPVVVWRNKDLRSSTNIFLINLSLADLLILLVCMPPVLIELHSKPEVWVLGAAMCKSF